MAETNGVGSDKGASGAGGPGPAGDASTSTDRGVSAADRSAAAAAAGETTRADVSAQADKVTGVTGPEDGFDNAPKGTGTREAANTPGPSRTPSEGTMAERERRAEEARVAAETRPRGPSEGVLAERARREDVAEINRVADTMARHSPTTRDLLDRFRAAGGQFDSIAEGGFFQDGARPTIAVGQGPIQERMETIAHELGHFDYRNNPDRAYVGPGNPTGATDRQIEHRRQADYITENTNRHLADEGHATIVNRQIRDELRAALGIDIGVAGDSPSRPMPNPTGTLAEQRRAIGDFFGSYLTTSNGLQNYRSQYGQPYIDFYRDNFLP